jgi:uroporphyrinogen decarboxylase
VALDNSVDANWAAAHVQTDGCVQGNLAPGHMVTGGQALTDEAHRIVRAFAGGPHIFNLGHGITPEADPGNVEVLLRAIRG